MNGKNNKKMVLILILILTAAAGFIAGCGGGTQISTVGSDPQADLSGGEPPETDAGPERYSADYLPAKNFGGYEFRVVAPEKDSIDGLTTDADIEEINGDIVNDALYNRNRLIEERYNIKFRQIGVPDFATLTATFKKCVTAGADDFDLGMMISRDAWAQAISGTIISVDNLPYLDISQPWYASEVNAHISIGGKLYFAYSDECLNMFEQTLNVMFNKQLAADLALDNMYTLVSGGKWTVDKFFEFARAAAADLDGDGEMTDTDRYGILSQFDMLYPCFWVSSGIKTVSKDENDLLVFTGDSEKLFNILEKTHQNIFGGEMIYFDTFQNRITSYQHQGGDDARRVSRVQFENDKGLFLVMHIGAIPKLRAMDTDFGILPFPKYDEAQEKYYSRVIDGWINCVPVTNTDPERTSVIMEALAVESKNFVIPAYFETALRTKHARDDESQEMLDIIHANRTMDLGDTFYMTPVRDIYIGVLNGKKNNFASAVERSMNTVNRALQTANEAAMALD